MNDEWRDPAELLNLSDRWWYLGQVVHWIAWRDASFGAQARTDNFDKAEQELFQALADGVVGALGMHETGGLQSVPRGAWVMATSSNPIADAMVTYPSPSGGDLGGNLTLRRNGHSWTEIHLEKTAVLRVWPATDKSTQNMKDAKLPVAFNGIQIYRWLKSGDEQQATREENKDGSISVDDFREVMEAVRGKCSSGELVATGRLAGKAFEPIPHTAWTNYGFYLFGTGVVTLNANNVLAELLARYHAGYDVRITDEGKSTPVWFDVAIASEQLIRVFPARRKASPIAQIAEVNASYSERQSLAGKASGAKRRENRPWVSHALELAKAIRASKPKAGREAVAGEVSAGWKLQDIDPPGIETLKKFIGEREKAGEIPPRVG